MIEITDHYPPRRRLKVGDVVMVHRYVERPKGGGKPFWWRWLGTVVQVRAERLVKIIRFGADEGKDVVDVLLSRLDPEVQRIWFIPEEEWPDGVYAFRTRLILEGRLDDAAVA